MEHTKSQPVNLRDLGEVQITGQKHIVAKRLVRCGELSGLIQEDALKLKEQYGLKNIVDFRTSQERERCPDNVISGTEYIVLDFFSAQTDNVVSGSEKQMADMQNAEQVDIYMEDLYSSFITSQYATLALKQFIEILLRTKEGATLFHCFAGKDRTGIAAAVILSILGASKAEIVRDYLRTNTMRQEENEKILYSFKSQGRSSGFIEALNRALCVREQYLDVSFKVAEGRYGSFEKYITYGIAIGEKEQSQLREMYLA